MRMTSTSCRNCAGTLYIGSPPENNGTERLDCTNMPWTLEYDGATHFMSCPHCSAKNIAVVCTDPGGTPVITINRAIMDDE